VLRYLQVENFAIVTELELEFAERLTVFTGETGAGKSILIQALGLVLGDRADSNMIRAGMDKAIVTAVFDTQGNTEVLGLLENQGIDGEECIVKRRLSSDGRSRAFVNGTPVTVQQLKNLGELLVDIHGQHEHQSLLKREVQRLLLDEFAGHNKLLSAVAVEAARWRDLSMERQSLTGGVGDIDQECERLRYDIAELEAIKPDVIDILKLETEHKRHANLSEILTGGETLIGNLAEAEVNAAGLLAESARSLRRLSQFDPGLDALAKLLDEATISVDEAVKELRHSLDSLENEPGALSDLENRLATLHDAARKFRCPIAELTDKHVALETRLLDLENREQRVTALETELENTRLTYQQSAERLTKSRQKYAAILAKDVTHIMQQLGMPGGRFEIDTESAGAHTPSIHGDDLVAFQVSANPGQPPRAIAKVASGGELSRISLAIQVCAARDKGIPTMVFDEVDAGIGGGVAEIVGQHLRSLAEKRQILCVTHLPQVACLGHQHLQVSKTAGTDHTATSIVKLGEAERTEEIARMLGGLKITEQTRVHAREMLVRGSR